MAVKLFRFLKKYQPQGYKKRKTAGYTILELLVAILISTAIVIVLGDFVVDLLNTERREYGRTETEREMQIALDYMVNDIREAAYVYTNKELNQIRGDNNNVPALRQFLQIPPNHEPILAFWKPEAVPYQQGQPAINCGNPGTADCRTLAIRRRTYTLVVYLQTINQPSERNTWKGISRIKRYQLRQYPQIAFNSSPPNLTLTPGFIPPLSGNNVEFSTWPGKVDGNGNFVAESGFSTQVINDQNAPVLVDFVDHPTTARQDNLRPPEDPRNQCPPTHPAIPPSSSSFNNPSFVACVSDATVTGPPGASENNSINQDVILFLRGNPTGKAGIKVAPLLAIRTQTVARGVINKTP